ncbi:2-succinyl-6-hydroxy-2,4-cyclohexadiene-1-carboxylate synthase [Staphylococcus massiliensis]|uniref:Putative 2-succinyl-6-hydroxy-2,4-cyclohexadiene-1-carboxylate synthase n=1 Tax=Staphylococcus massiliensis S46 TaxID=1229783 RepID=K9B211_9STAP|nr:2-succinyl-6-hydroxy-2,4-cyclohexadiene-1-carboxylate synthase [Staphylococcus massiliensis]EKU47795.1 hypothetical protein C273_07122 [Staphylococcus massiliensis S46]MCG3399822.1 2-succinyl-6-hydroxy-2,4-cyclohexadiene-1-carboxylate synthase [Staphylococcus massiliensis]MCG3401559.1 2-succinyl-6-hydroxy-2,4-cyclohexadiene-1-carboxylate synthase [Staphylococcus massiliensis]PNZ98268.1 2-succinyl-6-hydroxy-2,4-cyclohexadiene-1-carboxylate synthase [Staphylococcus massiliensis CCUG 55927]
MLHYNFYESKAKTNQLLVLLHGFISDGTTYEDDVESFKEKVNVMTIDLPGHGEDTSDLTMTWDFKMITHELDQILEQYDMYDLYLHGYSMGGRVAMYYALHGKALLKGLVLESTSPGIKGESDREERVKVDEARAKVLEIAGLEVFVNDWEKLPLFASQQSLNKETREAIRRNRMKQDPVKLAKALRDYGTGSMPNLWNDIKNIEVPVKIIVGELDEKFVSIAEKMEQLLPQSDVSVIKDAGHTVHVEDKANFDTIVLTFTLGGRQ